jgi:hypothetical protein
MADALGEEREPSIQKVVDKVFGLFVPMARREWLSWGGDLLFSDLQDEIECEEEEAKARRRMVEQEAEEVRKQLEEEEARQAAAEAKSDRLAARRAALGEARRAAMLEFRAKTLSREGLQKRNAEFTDEASAISRAEAGEEEVEVKGTGGAVEASVAGQVSKRKVGEVEEEGEDAVDMKRAKFASTGLLDFEGPVSLIIRLISFSPKSTSWCDRCTKFKSKPACVVVDGDVKCLKCTAESQGCYWEGVSRQGIRKGDSSKKGKAAKRTLCPRQGASRCSCPTKSSTNPHRCFSN